MAGSDKLTAATFAKGPMGLVWIQTTDKDHLGGGEFGPGYDCWLLVECATDRVMATIDAPYPEKLCYVVAFEAGQGRRFISLQGAQRYAIGRAAEMLKEETVNRCRRRYLRKLRGRAGAETGA
jgi:hypothetical protein